MGIVMSSNSLDFIIQRYDSILVIVKDDTKSQQIEKITTMYEDYCRTSGIHAKLNIRIEPFRHTRDYIDSHERYEYELGIDPCTRTKKIANFAQDFAK